MSADTWLTDLSAAHLARKAEAVAAGARAARPRIEFVATLTIDLRQVDWDAYDEVDDGEDYDVAGEFLGALFAEEYNYVKCTYVTQVVHDDPILHITVQSPDASTLKSIADDHDPETPIIPFVVNPSNR